MAKREIPSSSENKDLTKSLEDLLVEHDELDSEFIELGELWEFTKGIVHNPFGKKVLDGLDKFEKELTLLHTRQHQIITRMAEIESLIISMHRPK